MTIHNLKILGCGPGLRKRKILRKLFHLFMLEVVNSYK